MSASDAPSVGDDGAHGDCDDHDGTEAICPFCGSDDTEIESTFGSEVSKSQYYCRGCRTVFERIKYDGATPATGRERDSER